MKKLFVLLALLASGISFSQSKLTGNWTGTLYQDPAAGTPYNEYKFSMMLVEKNGVVTGYSTIMVSTNYGVLELTGTYSNNKFTFQENKIRKEKKDGFFNWCYKGGTIALKEKGEMLVLEGNWTGYTMNGSTKNQCSPGRLVLTKEMGFISLKGHTIDEKTSAPISAKVKIINLTTQKEETNFNTATGEFDIKLPGKNKYELTVESRGYLTRYEQVDLTESKILNIPLTPIQIGQNVPLSNILFERGTNVLTKDSYPELERLNKFLTDNSSVKIQLQGHTSSEGNSKDNMKLSELRVQTIKDYLSGKGIESSRISIKAFGGTKPIAPNDTEENRKKNRRVEFVIMSK